MFQTYVIRFSYEYRASSGCYIPVSSSCVCRLSEQSKGKEFFEKVVAPRFLSIHKDECRFLQFSSCEFVLNFLEE